MTTYKNLCDFLQEELEELDRRSKEKKLSNSEMTYGDQVAAFAYHLKKLANEAGETSMRSYDYSESGRDSMRAYDGGSRDGASQRSYRARSMRDRGYSEAGREELLAMVEDMMKKMPDEHSRRKLENMLYKLEEM